jgi:uncharacterized protein (DUF488 family)
MSKDLLIYTIGHSDHTTAAFVDLLRQHGVTVVADVRSQPYSRWSHQFNREVLARDLERAGMIYRFMGDALGGRPSDPAVYGSGPEEGRPDYARAELMDIYQAGIGELLELARREQIAVMCSEGDHRHCHRHLLIAQTLLARGVHVRHIQPDGRTVEGERIAQQLSFL